MINLLAKVLCIYRTRLWCFRYKVVINAISIIFQPSNIQFNRSSLYAYFWWGMKRHHINDLEWESADFRGLNIRNLTLTQKRKEFCNRKISTLWVFICHQADVHTFQYILYITIDIEIHEKSMNVYKWLSFSEKKTFFVFYLYCARSSWNPVLMLLCCGSFFWHI